MNRRDLLAGLAATAAAPLAGCSGPSVPATGRGAVFIPGYYFGPATPRNEPADSARRRAAGGKMTLITRIDAEGGIIQAAFPVVGHDIAIAPDRSVGFLGRMGAAPDGMHHVAFDPLTLEMAATGQPLGPGWRGGGHGVFMADGTVLSTERMPLGPYSGSPARHHGRLALRNPHTLAIVDTLPCHGIDPHEVRLMPGGRTAAVANYGSVQRPGTTGLGQPRHVVEASITLIDLASGGLVARYVSPDHEEELRHLALGRDSMLAIRARLGPEGADAVFQAAIGAEGRDITADPGETYLPSAPLLVSGSGVRMLARGADPADLRHGLSVEHDPSQDEFIASFPSSHRLIVFDGQTGAIRRSLDTRSLGLDNPSGIAILPDGVHYAVAGYWRDLHIFERGSHRHRRSLGHRPVLYGHSHMTAA